MYNLKALYAQSFRIMLAPPRITAAAGTELAGTSFSSTVFFLLDERALRPNSLLHSRDIAGSGFRPLSKIPHCCLPKESGPCLSPSVADHPLRTAKDRRLGELLPHQLPILRKALPTTISIFTYPVFILSFTKKDILFTKKVYLSRIVG